MKLILHDASTTSSNDFFSVLQFTSIQGVTNHQYGTRVPGLWYKRQGNYFHFNVDVYNNALTYEKYVSEVATYEVNREYNIHMQTEAAIFNGNQIHKTWISVDNIIVGVGYNYNAQVLNDVKVYCGNPGTDLLDTTIKDLEYGPLNSLSLIQGKFMINVTQRLKVLPGLGFIPKKQRGKNL